MHTPAAALAWEIWRKHRTRFITIVGLVLGFALVYPMLCARAGFDPTSRNALEELTGKFIARSFPISSPLRMLQNLYLLFLACGPTLAMFLSLLCVAWMFILTEFDPKTREAMRFPSRLFTLPVSTPLLFWFLWLGGTAAIAMLYGSWVYFVPLPNLLIYGVYMNCFGWMTLLALAQGIVWALDAWPNTRLVLLAAMIAGFLISPALREVNSIFESPILLPSLFVLGLALAYAGLQKMRHGEWQGWPWKWPFATMSARAALRGPKQFTSPAQAQLWFEWRRSARGLCILAAVLAVTPVFLHLLLRLVAGFGPLTRDTILCFAGYLLAIPLILHFCFGASPARTDATYLMLRPMTNGQIMMAMLKAAAISTIISWLVVLGTLAVMPWLGDFHAAAKDLPIDLRLAIIVPAVILLTWRFIAANLCFVWSGSRRLAAMPALMLVAAYAVAPVISILSGNAVFWDSFVRMFPGLLGCLVTAKLLLAFMAFRVSLKRGLLAPSAVITYLVVWALLAATLLIPAAMLFHDTELMLPLSLGIVLFVPLARVGFCPIALAWNRHA